MLCFGTDDPDILLAARLERVQQRAPSHRVRRSNHMAGCTDQPPLRSERLTPPVFGLCLLLKIGPASPHVTGTFGPRKNRKIVRATSHHFRSADAVHPFENSPP